MHRASKNSGATSLDSLACDSPTSDRRRISEEVPIFALDTVLYPEGSLPLRIFEPRYLNMVSERLRKDAPFIVALIRRGHEPSPATVHSVGTLARIVDWDQLEDGLLGISTVGERRVLIRDSTHRADGLRVATEAHVLDEEPACTVPDEYRPLAELLRQIHAHLPTPAYSADARFDDASWLGYRMSELLPIPLSRKQHFLEIEESLHRLGEIRKIIDMISDGGEATGPLH